MTAHTQAQGDRPGRGRSYLIFAVAILMLISTLKVADRELLAPLYEPVSQELGLNDLQFGTYAESSTLEEGDYRDLPRPFWPIFDPAHPARCWCLRGWRDPEFCWKRRRQAFGS